MIEVLKASAPAKIILFGEHAVVYGQPAIAIPVFDVRAHAEIQADPTLKTSQIQARDLNIEFSLAEKNPPEKIKHIIHAIQLVTDKLSLPNLSNAWRLDIWSQIPVARGMGSSAAISIVLIKILHQFYHSKLAQSTLLDLSFELEKYHHGRPSGIDNTVIALEKPILFQRGKEIQIINPQEFHFVIGDTGVGKKTSQVVAEVAERHQINEARYDKIFESIGVVAIHGLNTLAAGDANRLGQLMNQNQRLLTEIGVSSPELDKLIKIALESGALGAKLCGAGQGGCMVALAATRQQARAIAHALTEGGAVNSFITVLKAGA